MRLLYQWWAFLKRDYLLTATSPLGLTWQVANVALATPMLFYLARLIRPAASPHLAPYAGDYFGFAITGIALFGLLVATMGAAGAALRHEQLIGTLETLLTMPAGLGVVAGGVALWPLVLAAGQALLYLALGGWVFGVDFSAARPGSAALVAALSAVSFGALGMIAAAFVLLFRHAEPVTPVFAGLSALLGGLFYPPTVLPPALQRLSEVMPLTYALRAFRLTLLGGADPAALRGDLLVLALFALLLTPLALLVFRQAVITAKRAGTLVAY